MLIDDLSFSLPRNGIVGVIGPNGVGKSTLFKMIVGLEGPTSGTLEVGETVKLSYVDQMRQGLDAEKSLWEVVSDGNDYIQRGRGRDVRAVPTWRPSASRVGTSRSAPVCSPAASATASTSRSRSSRAETSCSWTSRPTTSTSRRWSPWRRRCEEFPGCSVVISHDRWFLDRVATHILAWEGD